MEEKRKEEMNTTLLFMLPSLPHSSAKHHSAKHSLLSNNIGLNRPTY
jgi:hypothetical protein